MAKKKEPRQEPSNAAMDDSSVKLQSLKTLNHRLLKETVELRKEKEKLERELTEVSNGVLGQELEMNLVCDFVRTHMDEIGDEFCGLMEERSEREKHERETEIGLLKDEINELNLNNEKERDELRKVCSVMESDLSRFERVKNEEFLSELTHLRAAMEKLAGERDDAQKGFSDEKKKLENLSILLSDKDKRIAEAMDELGKVKIGQEVLMKERDSMEQNLLEALSKIDDMRAEINLLKKARELSRFERVKNEELLSELSHLRAAMVKLAVERDDAHKSFSDEKEKFESLNLFYSEAMEELEENGIAEEVLMKEKDSMEKMVEEMKQLVEIAQTKEHKKNGIFILAILAAVSAVYVSTGR